jgi:hypothetical protein
MAAHTAQQHTEERHERLGGNDAAAYISGNKREARMPHFGGHLSLALRHVQRVPV